MKNRIFEHIEFLLPKHNCVIVPDFGGFIVNVEPAKRQPDGSMNAPQYSIVFNKDLKYNDGLLASSIQSTANIPYSSACQIINDCIKHIRQALLQGKPLICGNIGVLQLDKDNNITFVSNAALIHPHLYGLDNVNLVPIAALESSNIRERKSIKAKYTFSNIAAVAAAILLFAIPSVKIGHSNQHNNATQQAGFINTFKQSFVAPPVETHEVNTDPITDIAIAEEEGEAIPTKPGRTYYIIIGGEQNENRASRLLRKFHSQGFENAAIVKSPTFYRIYIAAYDDKNEAERFLDIFRLENPKYATAWLYSQRNY